MQELFTRFNLLQTVQAINKRLDLPAEEMRTNLSALGGRHHHYGVRRKTFLKKAPKPEITHYYQL